ncbi:MAG TPA: protein kinase [Bryobacteraceae bacterium]|nr:protein kinase [Bryobacteraceae bacterium]
MAVAVAVASDSPPDEQATVVATAGAFSAISGAAPARGFAELPLGHLLNNRYEILARLGQGGMGTVYKVLDRELDRVIALKTIRPDLATNASSLRRLKQETLLARQIAHRNVIRVFDLGVADGLRFITMEFVGGQDLRHLLDARTKLTVEETIDLLAQLCRGLQAAHSEDVVHRDLKPHNILLSADGRIRIVDFGLARSFEDTRITHTGGILGTPTYMSPEQALGQDGDARSDIFALGVIAFELLTGQLPFPNQPLSEALLSRTRGVARRIETVDPTLPPWLAKLVMRCLERNPLDRFATAAQVLAEMEARGLSSSTAAALAPSVLTPGAMVGTRYRIEAEAGEGGIGKVYRAIDLDLHRMVALKVVRPELAQSQHTLDQLMQEISIASQISHKNVLRIHDLGEASGLRFVSMAWAEGEDLSQLLRRAGPLPEARIRELAIEIGEGLEAAHEQGISHRDLKPSNILLTSAGHACIADFGLARSTLAPPAVSNLSDENSSSSAGTPRYMSPEQVDGATVDHRTDIYSLGLILYEMATGRIPFGDASVVQTITQRLTEIPANPKLLNPSLSENLSGIILRCLERDPAQRYSTVQDLLFDLRHSPDPLKSQSLPGQKQVSRHWWLASSLVALVLLAVGATVLWQRRKLPVKPPVNGKYVAVLPFHFVGSDPNLKYRAQGIAEAVSARLVSLTSLHPVSSAALERTNLSQPESTIGQQVGANLLIEGTVQGEGDRIKVDAQIYNVEKHRAVWSHSYTGVNADLFTLEEEIADDTEQALDVKPTLEEREREVSAPTQNLAAYDLYLKGRDILRNHRDQANARVALALFEQACRTDSSFALAWTGVADASTLLHNPAKALMAAEQARRLNSDLPEVHFALGSAYSATGRNAEAVSEIKQALQLSPNSDNGYIRLGRAYMATGQRKEALDALNKAVQLNPYYWYNHKQLGYAYNSFGMLNEAQKQFQEEIAQNPSDAAGYSNVGTIYWEQAQWNKAIPEFEKAIKLQPSFDEYSNLASAYYQLGHYKESIPIYEKALALNPTQPKVVRNIAEAYARSGQHELADQTFKKAIGLFYDALAVNHQDASAFDGLALCYVGIKNTPKARALIAKARAIDNADSSIMYDEAYVEASDGQIDKAVIALKNAFAHGFPFEYFLSDPDLKSVRDSPDFKSLKKQYGHLSNKGLR